jgi:hypothetical protein
MAEGEPLRVLRDREMESDDRADVAVTKNHGL